MHAQAGALFYRMTALVGRHLPPCVSPSYFDGFVRRNRPALVAVLDRHLQARRPSPGAARSRSGGRSGPWRRSTPRSSKFEPVSGGAALLLAGSARVGALSAPSDR